MGTVTTGSAAARPDLVEPAETLRLASVLTGFSIELRNIEARLVDRHAPPGAYYPCILFATTGEAAAFLPILSRLIHGVLSARERRRFHAVTVCRDPGGPGGLMYFPGLQSVARR